MKRAALYSALLHVMVLIILSVGMYNPFRRATVLNQPPILVEIAEIQEVSTAPVLTPETQEEEIKQSKPPQPKPQEQPPPAQEQPVPQKQEQPQPQEEPAKAPPAPEPTPEPTPVPRPQEKPKVVEKKLEEKPITPSPRPKALVNLSQKEAKEPKAKTEKKSPSSVDTLIDEITKESDKPAKAKPKGAPASQVGEVISTSDMEALRRHMRNCWIVPAGAPSAKDLIVDIDLEIAQDGTVIKADIVDKGRMATDSFYQAAAESALRAVRDPRCQPLPLPPEKYHQWKNLTMSFNPKDMF